MKQHINEIHRMQQLAGIIKEEMESNLPNKGVILYASWLSNNTENQENFTNSSLYPGKNKLTKENSPGLVNGSSQKGIECMATVFPYISDPDDEENEGEDFKITVVKFKKSIDEVFIDYGDNQLDSFDIIEDIKKAQQIIANNKKNNIPTPLSSLTNSDNFNENQEGFYGCYVNDIKSNEIISVKEFYQGNAPDHF
jgi:hypothetical protein